MFKRWIAVILGIGAAANGVLMLFAGRRWYDTVPDVANTGPFNPHFVADIGAAYFAAGLALAARGWRPRYWPAAIAGAAFFLLHAAIHSYEIACGMAARPLNDVALVIAPALLALWAAWPGREA